MKKIVLFSIIFAILFSFIACNVDSETEGETTLTENNSVRSVMAAANSSSIVLAWLLPLDTSNYVGVKIQWSSTSSGSNYKILNKNTTTCKVSGLTANTSYTFKIITLDKSWNETDSAVSISITTSASSSTAGTTDTTAPASVTNLTATAGLEKVLLTWKNPSDSDFFGAKISISPEVENIANSFVVVGESSANSSTLIEGLTGGTEYAFSIFALDKSLNESAAATVTATPLSVAVDTTAPAEVTNLTATNLDSAVQLSWEDPTDSDLFGIEITYKEDSSSVARAIVAMEADSIFVAPGTKTCEISNLTNGTAYIFTAKSMDTSGNKSDGESVEFTPTAIEGNVMKITLTPSTSQPTDGNVTVAIGITTDASGIKTVKYASGEKSTSYFVTAGTEITADSDGAYSFEVSENGTYTAYVLDSDGRREAKTISISNINAEVPIAVGELLATYSSSSKKISVTWTTIAANIDHYLVSYYIESSEETTTVIEDEKVTSTGYSVEEVSAGSGTYTFIVKAVDSSGYVGEETTTSVTPKAGAAITKIEVEKYHVASKGTINVTIYGSDFDLIKNATNQTIQVQVVSSDGETIKSTTEATIDEENNKATASVTAPSDYTTVGTEYTVRANFLGSIDTEHITKVNVSATAHASTISLSTTEINLDDVESSTVTTATITGTNFDTANSIKIQLYDRTGAKYDETVEVDSSSFTQSTTEFTVDIPIPQEDEKYLVKVVIDSSVQSVYTTLWVYSVPKFTKFKIPKAGISASDGTVEATVIGKNFTVDGVDSSSFTISCGTSSVSDGTTVKIISDTLLTCTLNIPSTAAKYIVTVKSGTESIKGTFTVKDYSAYAVGDIVLADETLIPVAKIDDYTEDSSNPAVAVIGGFNSNGAAIGVAIGMDLTLISNLTWAPKGTTGYTTNFSDIACTYRSAIFTGDTDGCNNWDIVSAIDPLGTAIASTKYPAFNSATTYAESLGYSGNVASGWYLPSASELYIVLGNYSTVNTSMEKVGGCQIYGGTNYCSSSQCDSSSYVYSVVASSSEASEEKTKDSRFYALVIKQF